jgi:16S rRNA (cytidine1402-2'-O)-methyltransferase
LPAVRSSSQKPPEGSRDRKGRLFVVGTPIGNLEDLSPRAARILSEADALFCEDTRVTAKLSSLSGSRSTAPRISCPAPREGSRVPELLERLSRGETVALVSDAGMPSLSDPGERLVEAAAGAGFRVEVVPGPSAPAAALAVSGLPAVPHFFAGFLPSRAGERRRMLERLRDREETLVWFEAPHRLLASLSDAAEILGPRRASVARELTKLHEETLRGTLTDLAEIFGQRGTGRGEVTVVVQGNLGDAVPEQSAQAIETEVRRALEGGRSKRELSRDIGRRFGLKAREIYAQAVKIERGREGE